MLCMLLAMLHGPLPSEAAAEFKPVFIAIRSSEAMAPVPVKWENPLYNLTGWKTADGRVVNDVFALGDVLLLDQPVVRATGEDVRWEFTHPEIELEARRNGRRLEYSWTARRPGQWTVAYAGAPAAPFPQVRELFQPLVWNGRRLPESSFLIPDDLCSIPGCLVETGLGTVGVMADPAQFPFEMPNGRNRRFGVTVRNREGHAQPLVFLPFPGTPESQLASGDSRSFQLVLVDESAGLSTAFETVARDVCGFRDRRENTLNSLNQALENILRFAQSPAGQFDAANRAFAYPDSAGTVKNVSALHPLSLATVTDDEGLFWNQAVPILEFLLSREKFLFALSADIQSSQTPSRRLAGPAMPVSELAALERLTQGATPHFRLSAERLQAQDRMLNMEWVSPAGSWQNDLWLYRATGDPARLAAAGAKANHAIQKRLDQQPTDFAEAGTGTFFDYMLPPWRELYELWMETREPKHLAAAHKAAWQYAQMVWFYPGPPERDVEVNSTGFAPRRGRPGEPSGVPAPRETVPAWRVSEQGLICEGNGTVARLAIYLATHAPLFLRLSHDASDPFLRDIARSAMVGRFAGFPGYHFNTQYSTAQEKAEFAWHPFEDLRQTTSMHYNHSLPMAALVVDYLCADAYARSKGAIEFPAEYAEGYAYLATRVYGRPGVFYGDTEAVPWMPAGLVKTDNLQVNFVAARTGQGLCVALMNQCNRPLEAVRVQLDLSRFDSVAGPVEVEVWRDGERVGERSPVVGGTVTVPVSPQGITALKFRGLTPKPLFQTKLHNKTPGWKGSSATTVATPVGPAHLLQLSFGEDLTWLYGYLDCAEGSVKNVRLRMRRGGQESVSTDDAYPFEFHVPGVRRGESVKVEWEWQSAHGVRGASSTGLSP